MKIRYIGPLTDGAEFAPTGDVVYPGDVLEVDDELGIVACEQTTNWEPADRPSEALWKGFLNWVDGHVKVDGVWRVKAPADDEAPVAPAGEPDTSTPAPADTSSSAETDTTPAKPKGRTNKGASR